METHLFHAQVLNNLKVLKIEDVVPVENPGNSFCSVFLQAISTQPA